MKAIGKQLRQRREAEGITQIQLAARATVSRNMISRIERDKTQNTSLATLRALADALDCDLVVKLKPREPERQDDFYTKPGEGIVSFGVDPAKIDPHDAEVQATKRRVADKIEGFPWNLIGDSERQWRITMALYSQGDVQTAEAYLDALAESTDTLRPEDFYVQQGPQPALPRSCLDDPAPTSIVITPKEDIPRTKPAGT